MPDSVATITIDLSTGAVREGHDGSPAVVCRDLDAAFDLAALDQEAFWHSVRARLGLIEPDDQ